MRKILISTITLSVLILFVFVSTSYATVTIFDGQGVVTCGWGREPVPCTFNDALLLLNAAIKSLGVAAFIIATITFTIAGWNIMTHPDNPSEREKAKAMFRKTIIGIFFALCAFLIVKLIVVGFQVEGDVKIFRWIEF